MDTHSITDTFDLSCLSYSRSSRRESGFEGVVSLLLTPFCVGVTVKRSQPIGIVIEILHNKIILHDFSVTVVSI